MINVANIHKTYDDGKVQVQALRGIDLEIKAGEFTAIVGPSGSGKNNSTQYDWWVGHTYFG